MPWGQPPQEPALCSQGSGLAEPHHSPGTPAGGAHAPSRLSPEIWNTTCACRNEEKGVMKLVFLELCRLHFTSKNRRKNTYHITIFYCAVVLFQKAFSFLQTNVYDNITKDCEVICVCMCLCQAQTWHKSSYLFLYVRRTIRVPSFFPGCSSLRACSHLEMTSQI